MEIYIYITNKNYYKLIIVCYFNLNGNIRNLVQRYLFILIIENILLYLENSILVTLIACSKDNMR